MNELSTVLLNEIRQILNQTRQSITQVVNSAMVETYWQIGRMIVEHEQKGEYRAEYGKKQLATLSVSLQAEFGKGFDARNLNNMKRFYVQYPIWNAVSTKLSWTHYRVLIRIENPKARAWYLQESIDQNWSVRALERQIGTLYYERLLSSQDQAPVIQEATANTDALTYQPRDFLRDPYILDFLNLPNTHLLESDLEQALIDNLRAFLLELGKGFAFVSRQERISMSDQDFYIDLVFYHFKLKCFVLIDLKVGKLTHQDVGQMDTYIRLYDAERKSTDDHPTIGLILCSEKSEAIVKYSVLTNNAQMFASEYKAYLPTETELRNKLEYDRARLENQIKIRESHDTE